MSYCISTKHNIGFVSTRFSTTDGVSLETSKWARVLEGLRQQCFYFAGECDRPAGVSYVVSEAHFNHPEINAITEIAYSQSTRPKGMTGRIHALRKYLKAHLYAFIKQFDIDLLIVENALSIPAKTLFIQLHRGLFGDGLSPSSARYPACSDQLPGRGTNCPAMWGFCAHYS